MRDLNELRWIVNGFLEWHEGAECPDGLIERARAAVPSEMQSPPEGGEGLANQKSNLVKRCPRKQGDSATTFSACVEPCPYAGYCIEEGLCAEGCEIRQRINAARAAQPARMTADQIHAREWWCPHCRKDVPPEMVTKDGEHYLESGGCGYAVRGELKDATSVEADRGGER